jgi:hypothetical protein
MDLANLLPAQQELVIKLHDGTPTDVVFYLVGQDSKAFREVSKRHAQAYLAASKPDVNVLEKQNAELLAACIMNWKGLSENGNPVPYSSDKALELMLMPELTYIREQVEQFIAQRANFFRKSSGTVEENS